MIIRDGKFYRLPTEKESTVIKIPQICLLKYFERFFGGFCLLKLLDLIVPCLELSVYNENTKMSTQNALFDRSDKRSLTRFGPSYVFWLGHHLKTSLHWSRESLIVSLILPGK